MQHPAFAAAGALNERPGIHAEGIPVPAAAEGTAARAGRTRGRLVTRPLPIEVPDIGLPEDHRIGAQFLGAGQNLFPQGVFAHMLAGGDNPRDLDVTLVRLPFQCLHRLLAGTRLERRGHQRIDLDGHTGSGEESPESDTERGQQSAHRVILPKSAR